MTAEHPLLERSLGPLTLRLVKCNGNWHGELIEDGQLIWTSRGELAREPVEERAATFAAGWPIVETVVTDFDLDG